VAQKSPDLQIRNYGKAQRRAERALAARTANASDCESEYVADAREFAARMIRLLIMVAGFDRFARLQSSPQDGSWLASTVQGSAEDGVQASKESWVDAGP
jgi:hypothetical protein